MKTITSLVTSCSFLLLVVTSASADVMLSNLDETNNLVAQIGNENGGIGAAIQFSTGSSAPAWNLDTITLDLDSPSRFSGGDSILYSASIYSDNGNAPGSQLASLGSFNFTTQTTSAIALQVTFDPSSAITLSPDFEYWIVVGAQTAGYAGGLEGTTSGSNEISGNGWQYGVSAFYYLPTGGLLPSLPGTLYLEIDATAQSVPEPFGLPLAGVGGMTIFICRLWKRLRIIGYSLRS